MKLIINADDCGKSKEVNEAIAQFIEAGKITSTTVMANMDDLEGAAQLFDKYGKKVSFGVHLNLTEGHPLLYSNMLIEKGLYKEIGKGKIAFNLRPYRNKMMGEDIRKELEKELYAQIEKVMDYGIRISHFTVNSFGPEFSTKSGRTMYCQSMYGINGNIYSFHAIIFICSCEYYFSSRGWHPRFWT